MLDPTKKISTLPLSIKEIPDELLLKSLINIKRQRFKSGKDKDLKRQPSSCFVNNYINLALKTGQANMDIQSVFN